MARYLLTNGESTDKMEVYILDLFKLYLSIHPNDVPHSEIGFDFNLTDIRKDELLNEVKSRVNNLVKVFKNKFKEYSITVSEISLINEEKIKLILEVNKETQIYELSTKV
jgi:hypothetical protein